MIQCKRGEIPFAQNSPLFSNARDRDERIAARHRSEIELIDRLLGKDQRLSVDDFSVLPNRVLSGFTGWGLQNTGAFNSARKLQGD